MAQLRLSLYFLNSVCRLDNCKSLVLGLRRRSKTECLSDSCEPSLVHINEAVRLNLVPKRGLVFEVLALFLGSSIHHYRPVDVHLKVKVVLFVAGLVL
jgi:hypothetical protein